MNIIFVGSIVDRYTLTQLSDASVAGNKMQLGFIKGFLANGVDVKAISVEPHKMWKFNRSPIFVKENILCDETARIHTIPYINLPFLKQLSVYWHLYKDLKKYATSGSIVCVYNTMSMFALPVIKIACKKHCKSVAIVADLPIKTPKNIIRRIEDYLQEKWIGKFDYLVPLTDRIPRDFAPNTPFCVVEAGFSLEDYACFTKLSFFENGKNVVFSGTLNHLSGIGLLLAATEHIDQEDIKFHIFGEGDLKNLVQEYASRDPRIVYHGRVDNHTMLVIQREADLLVCPRCSDDFTTKYTFPSKLLEYVCSGTPVLANRLEGIPQEYDNYVSFCPSESPEDWASAILLSVSEKHMELKNKAENAKNKVLFSKNWMTQCKRVLDFLQSSSRQGEV